MVSCPVISLVSPYDFMSLILYGLESSLRGLGYTVGPVWLNGGSRLVISMMDVDFINIVGLISVGLIRNIIDGRDRSGISGVKAVFMSNNVICSSPTLASIQQGRPFSKIRSLETKTQ